MRLDDEGITSARFGPCRSEQISRSIVSTAGRLHQDLVMGWTKRSESRMWMKENKKDLEDSGRAGSADAKKAIGRETPLSRDARPRPATKEEVATRREINIIEKEGADDQLAGKEIE